MIRTVIESPYAGHVSRNLQYLRMAMKDCLQRQESPYASHGLLPQCLDDNDAAERHLGITAGLAWAEPADIIAFYLDFGMSSGMTYALEYHVRSGKNIQCRYLSGQTTVHFDYDGRPARAKYNRFFIREELGEVGPVPVLYMEGWCIERRNLVDFRVKDMVFHAKRGLLDLPDSVRQ